MACAFVVACGVAADPAAPPRRDAASPPSSASNPVPTAAVVEGTRLSLEKQVHGFVNRVTRRVDGESPALWHVRLCPLVAGLPQSQGEHVLERVTAHALAASVAVGSAQCRPNLFVVFTGDPEQTLRIWRTKDPGMFGHVTRANVERFIASKIPVRAWYNISRVGADGVMRSTSTTAPLRLGGDLTNSPDAARMPNSRLERATVLSFDSVIVVVDTRQTAGQSLDTIVDYATLLGFAELRPHQDFSAVPTILNLFSATTPDRPPGGLTDWDRSLLSALYATNQHYTLQRSQVAQRMLHDQPDRAPVD
jgi:hypothetical protein